MAVWLFGIAANVCRGYYRYQKRHPQTPLESVQERMDAHTSDPERHAYHQSILGCALRVMPQLSEERHAESVMQQNKTGRQDARTIADYCAKQSSAPFLAEVPDISRFTHAGQLAAFAGLTPGQQQCGSSLHRPGRLVK